MEVVSKLMGLQAQFANNPKYALQIRAADFDEAAWSRDLVKTWSLRHTLHVIPKNELGLYLSARGQTGDWTDTWDGMKAKRVEFIAGVLMENIKAGVTGRGALKDICRAAGLSGKEMEIAFNPWGGIFAEMFKRGLIAYHPGTEKKFITCEKLKFTDREEARAELIRRYFLAYGPATIEDCLAFFHFRKREMASRIKEDGRLNSLTCDGEGYLFAGEIPPEDRIPECLFLTGFDPMMMGYKKYNRTYLVDKKYLGEIVTLQGIIFPCVLLGGRVQAKWRMEKQLLVTPLEEIPLKNQRLIRKTGEEIFRREVIFV
jgi:hypothetical protein